VSEYALLCIDMRVDGILISAMQGVSRSSSPGDADWIRCQRPCRRRGCSWGGGPGSGVPALAHRGARVGMAGGDLDIAQVDASIEHGPLGPIRWLPGGSGRRSGVIAPAGHSPHTGSVSTISAIPAGLRRTLARGEMRRCARTGHTLLPLAKTYSAIPTACRRPRTARTRNRRMRSRRPQPHSGHRRAAKRMQQRRREWLA
jgi:hypothetical protein